MSTGLVTKIFRDSGRRKCRAKQHFHINKHTYSSSFAYFSFKKSGRGQGREALVAVRKRRNLSCRTPQSAKSPSPPLKNNTTSFAVQSGTFTKK